MPIDEVGSNEVDLVALICLQYDVPKALYE